LGDADSYLKSCGGGYDVIISNPPYIRSGDIAQLPPEVKEYEPLSALDGGEDGLDFYRCIVPLLPTCLTQRGLAAFEIGSDQGDAVRELLIDTGFENVRVFQDYNTLDRVVTGRAGPA
jgi:release factor glutamine methyltransferase